MNTSKQIIHGLLLVATLVFAHIRVLAIEGLKIQIYCPDVVLSWPSVEGYTYIVQHRETLGPNTPWTTLTNSLPAKSGTNMTFFVHSNRVDCPTGQVFGRMLSSGGGSSMMKSAAGTLSAKERAQIQQAREEARLTGRMRLELIFSPAVQQTMSLLTFNTGDRHKRLLVGQTRLRCRAL